MNRQPTKILIVDDSPLVREMICDALAAHPDLNVVGVAANGKQALELATSLQPDLITLDLHMPQMAGLETLDALLAQRPVPVIVVSSSAARMAELTLQALDRGAMDYLQKPVGAADARHIYGEELPRKIRNMAGADVERVLRYRRSRALKKPVRVPTANAPSGSEPQLLGCIALGISTGGPPALSTLLSALSPPLPAMVIVQHMPEGFTKLLASRLATLTQLRVKEAAAGDVLRANEIFIAPAGVHLSLRRIGSQVRVELESRDPVSGHRPSVDVMMTSVAQAFGNHCLGVVMTGMGRDGSDGCRAIRQAGGYVLGQDEGSSDVYGMNKVAFTEGNVDQQVSLDQMAAAITKYSRRMQSGLVAK